MLTAFAVCQLASSAQPAQAGGVPAPSPARRTAAPSTAAHHPGPARDDAATTLGLHWIRPTGQAVLVVRVVDETGPAWPVHAAARLWRTRHVQMVAAQGCAGPGPCIVVREARFGRTGWTGRTRADRGDMSSFVSPVSIFLNDSYDEFPRIRQAVACHELGHALGLAHDDSAASCLQRQAATPRPGVAALVALERLYRLPD
ncbi:MAG: hypothetical protein NVS3B26_07320 [Mycobacteriales bacterium]